MLPEKGGTVRQKAEAVVPHRRGIIEGLLLDGGRAAEHAASLTLEQCEKLRHQSPNGKFSYPLRGLKSGQTAAK